MTVAGPTLTAEVGGQMDETFQLTAAADVELQHIHSTGNGVTFGVELLDANSQPVNTTGSALIPAGQYRLRTTNTYSEGSFQDFSIAQTVIVSIPEPTAKAATCATGKSHRFKLKLPRALLRLEVQLEEPHHYELLVGGETFPGTTDGKSPIEHRIPPLAAEGRLELWPATEGNEEAREGAFFWDLAIGHLDPIEMLSGVQGRLANLGYYSGPIDGRDSPDLSLAIASFESDMELTVTGKADGEALQSRLREVHDGG
jgi:N-acetylmuramoyl-L-alanine amidase